MRHLFSSLIVGPEAGCFPGVHSGSVPLEFYVPPVTGLNT